MSGLVTRGPTMYTHTTLNIHYKLKDKSSEKTAGGTKSTRISATNNPLWRQLQCPSDNQPFMATYQGQALKFRCFPQTNREQITQKLQINLRPQIFFQDLIE